jgi:hypothetical protein
MRYFVYLSAAKVDMLYPQVSSPARASSREFTVDLKVVKATQRSEGHAELTVHDKLTAVEDWIYAHEPVGSVDEPDVWLYGRTDLAVVTVTKEGRFSSQKAPEPAVFFAGRGLSGTMLLMGGSATHLAGGTPPPDVGTPDEPGARLGFWPSSVSWLHNAVAGYARQFETVPALNGPRDDGKDKEHTSLLIAADDILTHGAPLGECEFLAKRLSTTYGDPFDSTSEVRGLLTTPLFVAMLQ